MLGLLPDEVGRSREWGGDTGLVRFAASLARVLLLIGVANCVSTSATHGLSSCPVTGSTLSVIPVVPEGLGRTTAVVFGTLAEPSCDEASSTLAAGYARQISCDDDLSSSCGAVFSHLRPGQWTHRLIVTSDGSAAQIQARTSLLLGDGAGMNEIRWPYFRSVLTVSTLADSEGCTGCLREILTSVRDTPKPALVQFAIGLSGDIVLSSALPPLDADRVTIDGIDFDGQPQNRGLDGAGLNAAALKITGADNVVQGLRFSNVGGNSDTVLIEGGRAHRNVLDSLKVEGRSVEVCGTTQRGCLINGACRTVETDPPDGACGDDAIAVRGSAGVEGANIIRRCDVIGAFDKGIKISNNAVAQIENSHLHGNADGGLQATLGGQVIAIENLIEDNRGTNSANGLAANGPEMGEPPPATLITRGNITRHNALRGISVRSLSIASLNDDYVCGNGTPGRGIGFGVLLQDAAGLSPQVEGRGLAIVHNTDGGFVANDRSTADLGTARDPGENALAFNGSASSEMPLNLRNLSENAIPAVQNYWEHCGGGWRCDVASVGAKDILADDASSVGFTPARPPRQRRPVRIDSVRPTFARAGDVVRLYGSGFDAIDGNGSAATCDELDAVNLCLPLTGNCVLFDGVPARVVAVTPTMIAVEAPFHCVEPISITTRNRRARGVGRQEFCALSKEVLEGRLAR